MHHPTLLKTVVLSFYLLLFLLLAAQLMITANTQVGKENARSGYKDYYLRPQTTAAEILRARGFIADEFFFKTSEGYVLCIVRGRNPLFKAGSLEHKRPILFMHGSISAAPIWLVNSRDAKPEDLTKIVDEKFSRLSLNKLIDLVGGSESARSLPLMALNFGHEVWLMNRRGFLQSEQKTGHLDRSWMQVLAAIPKSFTKGGFSMTAGLLSRSMAKNSSPNNVTITQIVNSKNPEDRKSLVNEWWRYMLSMVGPIEGVSRSLDLNELKKHVSHTFDADYWNFSLDEQAQNDFPQVVDFVLEKTGHEKLHLVAHSASGPIVLMGLSLHPEMAHKIAKIIHWSPCLNTGTKTDIFLLPSYLMPMIQSYIGPLPFSFVTAQLQTVLQTVCSNELKQRTICTWLLDVFFGPSNGQSPGTRYVCANIMQPTSSHEIQHIVQMTREIRPRKFIFNSEKENIKKYGQAIPPEYDFSKIIHRDMVFYTGNHDIIASKEMMQFTLSQLSVPYKFVFINETGIKFNHAAPITHDQVTRLVVLPSLMDIELDEERTIASN